MDAKETTIRLIKAKKNIKRKLAALKANKLLSEEHLKKTYNPLTESLRSIITSIPSRGVKIEQLEGDTRGEGEIITKTPQSTPAPRKKQTPSPIKKPTKQALGRSSLPLEEDEEFIQSLPTQQQQHQDETFELDVDPETQLPHNIQSAPIYDDASFSMYLEQFGPLAGQYIKGLVSDPGDEYDTGHAGVHHDTVLDKFHLGNGELEFNANNDNITVKGKEYKGTRGLYELIFKKNPQDFNLQDENNYKEILQSTGAAMVNYNPNNQLAGNRSKKYTQVVAPILHGRYLSSDTSTPVSSRSPAARLRTERLRSRIGLGLIKTYNNKPLEYVYYDDINELVDRLRLLIASQTAGSDAHTNEIQSIIEELREARVIV